MTALQHRQFQGVCPVGKTSEHTTATSGIIPPSVNTSILRSFAWDCHLNTQNWLRTCRLHWTFTAGTRSGLYSPLHFPPHVRHFYCVERVSSKQDSKDRVTEPCTGLVLEGYSCFNKSKRAWESRIAGKCREGDCDLHESQEHRDASVGHKRGPSSLA